VNERSLGEVEMEEALAMTILGLKSAGDALVKKLISTACSIPKAILKLFFRIQLKIIYLSFSYLIRIYGVVKNSAIFKYIFPEKISSPEPVVDQKAVVKGAKKVRRALCLSLEQFYGRDLKSDMDLIQERIDEVHKCMDEDDDDKTFEALARLRELNKPFEDGSWKDKYITDLDVREYIEDDSETEEKPTNILEETERTTKFRAGSEQNEQENLSSNERKMVEKVSCTQLEEAPTRKKNLEKGAFKNKLTVTNAKLEEVLKMSSNLVAELTRLNGQVCRLAVMSEKMASMQNELGEGRKLLNEIEADRNAMKRKLSILERMIQEEEQYLDDVSCESGYDEGETPNHSE